MQSDGHRATTCNQLGNKAARHQRQSGAIVRFADTPSCVCQALWCSVRHMGGGVQSAVRRRPQNSSMTCSDHARR